MSADDRKEPVFLVDIPRTHNPELARRLIAHSKRRKCRIARLRHLAVEAVRRARANYLDVQLISRADRCREFAPLLALLARCAEELGDTAAVAPHRDPADIRKLALHALVAIDTWRRSKDAP